MNYTPHAISWNITKKCNLRCAHCYIDSEALKSSIGDIKNSELTTSECLNIIDQIAEVNHKIILILTGGEPLLRKDVFDLINHAKNLGMTLFLGTNGCLFNEEIVENLKRSGITGVGISLDSLNQKIHNSFRGTNEAWNGAIKAAEMCKDHEVPFQIQTTVTKSNIKEVPEIIKFSKDIGASAFQLFFLVCTGRGQGLTDITPVQYEETLTGLYETQKGFKGSMLVGAKCAPHYKRIVFSLDQESPLLKAYEGGCPAGTSYCRITSEGQVTACPYIDKAAGDLKEHRFSEIWRNSVAFDELRGLNLKGKCARCEFKSICKGCRARALATNNDQLEEDPWCLYEPAPKKNKKERIEVKLREENIFGMKAEFNLPWTDEAKERLSKVPSFIKGMAIKGAERYAKENGYKEVTPEVMKAARENMGKDNKAMFPFGKMFKKKAKEEGETKGEVDSSSGSDEKLYYLKDGKIPWTETAKKRVENAPNFVRPGIYKLMQKRAKEEGESIITTEFLSKIRDESMFLAAGRMKKFGFGDLKMEVFEVAKNRIRNDRKKIVIDEIKEYLDKRTKKNEKIITLFEEYLKPTNS